MKTQQRIHKNLVIANSWEQGYPSCVEQRQQKQTEAARTCHIYMWENRLNSSCRSLLVRRSFFLKGAPNHGKRYGELSKAIPCNAIYWNTISSEIIACNTWNCLFFCTFSPVPKRYPKRYLSDTLLAHKCSRIHPVPRNQKETKSRLKRPEK